VHSAGHLIDAAVKSLLLPFEPVKGRKDRSALERLFKWTDIKEAPQKTGKQRPVIGQSFCSPSASSK